MRDVSCLGWKFSLCLGEENLIYLRVLYLEKDFSYGFPARQFFFSFFLENYSKTKFTYLKRIFNGV